MLTFIDKILDKATMYRITLYSLVFILGGALFLSSFGILHFNPFSLLFSAAFLLFFCSLINGIFANVFEVPANDESVYITALILTALITPPSSTTDWRYYALAFWVAVWAMAGKFMFAVKRRHIFNPAAFSVVLVSLTLGLSASWWIGTPAMLPFVLIGGSLLVRKIGRFDLVGSFLSTSLFFIIVPAIAYGGNFFSVASRALGNSPLFFFAFIMLTEPLTTPPTKKLRIIYGAVVGFLFAPWVHAGSMYSTPELALLIGNLGTYFVSTKDNLLLKLKKIEVIATDTAEFIFESPQKLRFKAGQYMEWTLTHENPDSRGVRRYLTISSSPTEDDIRIGVKFCDNGSTFKKKLLSMEPGDTITASHLVGDFVLPLDTKQKLAFIAGGIGITPFRSMIKYEMDTGGKRDIILMYANKKEENISYKNIFTDAAVKFRLKTIYIFSDKGESIDKNSIEKNIPDYRERTFYIAGPMAMVIILEKVLKEMGLKDSQIKKDFFPGF
ncbi:MAG: RnfABCDGE type electron transport complex subunit D [Candidatus Parcubacteria bacterium]|nr:RnfABCDGE type electron transport complex subunit D [Candidatus Parcubacteria bacterium]